MDEYFDQFLASTSWSDPNAKESPFWICNEADQLNGYGLLPNSVGSYESDIEISAASLMGSSHTTVESFTSQESSTVITGAPHPGSGSINAPSNFGYMGMPLNSTKSTLSPLNLGATNELLSYEQDVKARCYGFETLPPNPQLWNSPSYEGVGSLPPLGNGNLQGVGLQEVYGERNIYGLGNKYVQDVIAPQPEKLSVNVPMKGNENWRNHHLSSLVLQPQRTMTLDGIQSPSQTASVLPSGNCNGNGKPRVRARRGQATDPHSIAERHRREKIADGMKNLQELVPDSNKTDKASMLDEIIDYVKFLQLQVKVLSMSRLGAAEAVVPLVEGSNGMLLTPTKNQKLDSNPSCEQTAMEREVVKLMESNITMAIQYLQKKGLCLMPIALASALSNGKKQSSSSSCGVSEERSDSHSSCSNVTFTGSVLNMEDLNNNGSQAAQEVKPQI